MFDVPIFGWDRRQGSLSVTIAPAVLSSETADLATGGPSGISGGIVDHACRSRAARRLERGGAWDFRSPGGFALIGAAYTAGSHRISIAGYTVIDATAVGWTPVLVYAAWMFLLQGPVMPLVAVLRRGPGLKSQARPVLVAGLSGGVVSLAAYGLVLVAQTSGATAAVAALRETSIVFGPIIGAVLSEKALGPAVWSRPLWSLWASYWSICSLASNRSTVRCLK